METNKMEKTEVEKLNENIATSALASFVIFGIMFMYNIFNEDQSPEIYGVICITSFVIFIIFLFGKK